MNIDRRNEKFKLMISPTEQENPRTLDIDRVTTLEALRLINDEDKLVASAVEEVLPEIAQTVDAIAERLKIGGRLFYVGAGTSGRLGVLDASELPPTFGVSCELVQGVIAGGYDALYKASESSEDEKNGGAKDLKKRGLNKHDAVVGIAASGATAYTIGAVEYAKNLGCFTSCVTVVKGSPLALASKIAIAPNVGAEAIAGSSRMKAGTAQKMILNMVSTAVMIRLGYVKGNRMTNVKASNEKLKRRSRRILAAETGISETAAAKLFEESGDDLRVALVMHKAGANRSRAEKVLGENNFVIEKAIAKLTK